MKKRNVIIRPIRPLRPYPSKPLKPFRPSKPLNPRATVDIIPMHYRLDTDRDGVPDYKDCRPFDPTKQHVNPVVGGSEIEYENFEHLYEIIIKNARKLYNGGLKELKVVTTKIISRYLEHDKSRKSRIPFPNIPQIADQPHDRYEVDVKWELHEVPLGGVNTMHHLIVLHDKVKQVSVYFLIIMSNKQSSVYEFWKNEGQKQYIFYPEPKWAFLFAITDQDKSKLGDKDFKDFVSWIISKVIQG